MNFKALWSTLGNQKHARRLSGKFKQSRIWAEGQISYENCTLGLTGSGDLKVQEIRDGSGWQLFGSGRVGFVSFRNLFQTKVDLIIIILFRIWNQWVLDTSTSFPQRAWLRTKHKLSVCEIWNQKFDVQLKPYLTTCWLTRFAYSMKSEKQWSCSLILLLSLSSLWKREGETGRANR